MTPNYEWIQNLLDTYKETKKVPLNDVLEMTELEDHELDRKSVV